MKKIVLDTDVLIDYEKGYASWIEEAVKDEINGTILIIPTIVISEFLASKTYDDARRTQAANKTLGIFIKQELTEEIAKILASLLRHKSYPQSAGTADLIIASTALYLDAQLATRNTSDFASIPGLQIIDPNSLSR